MVVQNMLENYTCYKSRFTTKEKTNHNNMSNDILIKLTIDKFDPDTDLFLVSQKSNMKKGVQQDWMTQTKIEEMLNKPYVEMNTNNFAELNCTELNCTKLKFAELKLSLGKQTEVKQAKKQLKSSSFRHSTSMNQADQPDKEQLDKV